MFAAAVVAAFVIQWLAFVPALLSRSVAFFDITGFMACFVITVGILVVTPERGARDVVLGVLMILWSLRVGTWAFVKEIHRSDDDRLAAIRYHAPTFLQLWTRQGFWVAMTASAAWLGILSPHNNRVDFLLVLGALIWVLGIGFEAAADHQKRIFLAQPANAGRFIHTGLWARSRHPNYVAEVVVWIGVAVAAAPALRGTHLVGLLSPFFVAYLLDRVKAPRMQARADRRGGGEPAYQQYKEATPALLFRWW